MAKHWKQLIKQEEPTKNLVKDEENEENENFSLPDLLQPATNEKSLEDIAASNINLKSLLEEQKELEQNMNALTGKTEEHSTTKKQYDHEIKSVYQKRKEERKEEKKKNKLLKKRKNNAKENSNWNRKKKDFFNVDTTRKKQEKPKNLFSKKRKDKTEFATKKRQSKTSLKTFNNLKKATEKVSTISNDTSKTIAKTDKNLTRFSEKISQTNNKKTKISTGLKKISNTLNNVSKTVEKTDTKITKFSDKLVQVNKKKTKATEELKKVTGTIDTASKTIKKVSSITNDVSKNINKVSSLLSNKLGEKENTSNNKKAVLENKTFSTVIKTVGTVVNTAEKTLNTFNKIDKKKTDFVKSINQLKQKKNGIKNPLPTIKTNTKDANLLSEKLNKVNNFYENTKKHLDKTTKTITTVDNLFNNSGELKKSDKKEEASLELNSLDKIFTKKEEKTAKGFNTINVSEIFSAAKKIKEFADELPTKKKSASKKDPFSF